MSVEFSGLFHENLPKSLDIFAEKSTPTKSLGGRQVSVVSVTNFPQHHPGVIVSQAPANALPIEIQLRWSDQDLLAHVNNATIMRLAEEARIRALTQLQRSVGWEGPLDMVLRTAHTEFLRPVMYDDSITINVWVSRIGNSSFVLQHELVQDGEICVTIEAVVVAFDADNQAPMPLPDQIRAAFESVLASV